MIKISGNGWHGMTTVPNTFIDAYMGSANDLQLKTYLYILRRMEAGMETCISEIADEFNYTERDVLRSLQYWEKNGLFSLTVSENGEIISISILHHGEQMGSKATVQQQPAIADKATNYHPSPIMADRKSPALPIPIPENAAEQRENLGIIKNALEETKNIPQDFQSEFKNSQILFVIEEYIGKPLSPNEVNMVRYITEILGFSEELLDRLVQYCVDIGKRDFHFIRGEAERWKNKGIMTPAQAQDAIALERQNPPQPQRTTKTYQGKAQKNSRGKARYNSFNDFEQNTYDFDKLEEELLGTTSSMTHD